MWDDEELTPVTSSTRMALEALGTCNPHLIQHRCVTCKPTTQMHSSLAHFSFFFFFFFSVIRIGFAEQSYDVVESNTVQLVELIKEDNVVTDQTFSVNIAVLLGENLVLADPSSQPTVPPDDVALSNVSNGQVELVFPPDKQSLQLELTVFDDSVLELNETVNFVLSGSTEFSLGQITESTVTILNDEGTVLFQHPVMC